MNLVCGLSRSQHTCKIREPTRTDLRKAMKHTLSFLTWCRSVADTDGIAGLLPRPVRPLGILVGACSRFCGTCACCCERLTNWLLIQRYVGCHIDACCCASCCRRFNSSSRSSSRRSRRCKRSLLGWRRSVAPALLWSKQLWKKRRCWRRRSVLPPRSCCWRPPYEVFPRTKRVCAVCASEENKCCIIPVMGGGAPWMYAA